MTRDADEEEKDAEGHKFHVFVSVNLSVCACIDDIE